MSQVLLSVPNFRLLQCFCKSQMTPQIHQVLQVLGRRTKHSSRGSEGKSREEDDSELEQG